MRTWWLLVACVSVAGCGGRVLLEPGIELDDATPDVAEEDAPASDVGVGDGATDSYAFDDGVPDAWPDTAPISDTSALPDTAPPPDATPPVDGSLSLVHGSPDLGERYVCLGVFDADPAMRVKPLVALGPFGTPTPSGGVAPLRYGEQVDVPMTEAMRTAFNMVWTSIYLVPASALPPGRRCEEVWSTLPDRARTSRNVPRNTVDPAARTMFVFGGCLGTRPTGECGAGTNFQIGMHALDTTLGAPPPGSGARVDLQVALYSRFPELENTEIYFQDMGGTTPIGSPVRLAPKLAYGSIAASAIGVRSVMPAQARLLFVPPGTMPCITLTGAPSAMCRTRSVTLGPYLIGPTGTGYIGETVQAIVVVGAPAGAGTSALDVVFVRASK